MPNKVLRDRFFQNYRAWVEYTHKARFDNGSAWDFVGKPNGFQGVVIQVKSLINDVHSPFDRVPVHRFWDVVY